MLLNCCKLLLLLLHNQAKPNLTEQNSLVVAFRTLTHFKTEAPKQRTRALYVIRTGKQGAKKNKKYILYLKDFACTSMGQNVHYFQKILDGKQ